MAIEPKISDSKWYILSNIQCYWTIYCLHTEVLKSSKSNKDFRMYLQGLKGKDGGSSIRGVGTRKGRLLYSVSVHSYIFPGSYNPGEKVVITYNNKKQN